MANNTVILDACVLYPAPLRDLLLHLALIDVYHAKWTDDIHNEWIYNLLKSRKDLTRQQLLRTRDLMNSHVRDCLVEDYQELVQIIELPDANDRHVLAAAIKGSASFIVTFNTKDFPVNYLKKFGVEARHPDVFLADIIDTAPRAMTVAVDRILSSLRNPPISFDSYLDKLDNIGLIETAKKLKGTLSQM